MHSNTYGSTSNSNLKTSLLGNDPAFTNLLRTAQIVAATDVSVLILGESGTGKELLAHTLHDNSPRRNGPFIAINCAALPEHLIESELFGHRKGAFTGAASDQPGRIRNAHRGTLVLDEIGELPLAAQAKLLRFLESGECQSVGDAATHTPDVRVLASTHCDLYQRVKEGRFREDLYYRLNIVPLEMPSLRDRPGDIRLLIEHFNMTLSEQHGLPSPRYLPSALEKLLHHPWPGNVRELRNLCERLLILFSGKKIEAGNLPSEIRNGASPRSGLFTLPDQGIRLDELERDMIRQALDKTMGNRSRAARLLGLTRDTLLYRLKKYAILNQ